MPLAPVQLTAPFVSMRRMYSSWYTFEFWGTKMAVKTLKVGDHIQVRYDRETKERVLYNWDKAYKSYPRS